MASAGAARALAGGRCRRRGRPPGHQPTWRTKRRVPCVLPSCPSFIAGLLGPPPPSYWSPDRSGQTPTAAARLAATTDRAGLIQCSGSELGSVLQAAAAPTHPPLPPAPPTGGAAAAHQWLDPVPCWQPCC